MKVATICYMLTDDRILLGLKKERFGVGKWNGFGGRVEEGESIEVAAAREILEESGLTVNSGNLKQMAKISFYFAKKAIFECHVFTTEQWEGEPHETDEMKPQWFHLSAIPYKEMWASDLYWLPAMLAGHTFEAICTFDTEGNIVERFEMNRRVF